MTVPTTSDILTSTVEVVPVEGGIPYVRITHVSATGSVTYTPQTIASVDFPQLVAAGFVIDDPEHLITCYCGEFKPWWATECEYCRQAARDAADDAVMYRELAAGF